jgi:hypothetical protein
MLDVVFSLAAAMLTIIVRLLDLYQYAMKSWRKRGK